LGRVRGRKLGEGGIGVLTGRVSDDRGVVAERARGGERGVCTRKNILGQTISAATTCPLYCCFLKFR